MLFKTNQVYFYSLRWQKSLKGLLRRTAHQDQQHCPRAPLGQEREEEAVKQAKMFMLGGEAGQETCCTLGGRDLNISTVVAALIFTGGYSGELDPK